MGKYSAEYKKLHKNGRYGISSERIVNKIQQHRPPVKVVRALDYGSGQSNLLEMMKIQDPVMYDPNVVGRDTKPEGVFDWVICTDLLEHIPEDELDEVLEELFNYGTHFFLIIATAPAAQRLSNGDNAHCTVHNEAWWNAKIAPYMTGFKRIDDLCSTGRYAIKNY